MEVIIQPNQSHAAWFTAQLVIDAVNSQPDLVLGCVPGRTLEPVYNFLVQAAKKGDVDFSSVIFISLDEYIGLDPEHPGSFKSILKKQLYDPLGIATANVYIPNGMAEDLDCECRRYEAIIDEVGGIDLQLLGLGHVGHIGFNEPLSALTSHTRAKALTPGTRRQFAEYFESEEQVPTRAITVGVGNILESRHCIMTVTGARKAEILKKSVEGPVTALVTASALQLHPHCTIVTDEEAAQELEHKSYYRWIYENEPEWVAFRSRHSFDK